MWQEGLQLNPGFGISDVGLDVVMREHYSSAIPKWNAPHWTQPQPLMPGPTTELQQRYYPMTLAALWDMPQSSEGFHNQGPATYKAFMYHLRQINIETVSSKILKGLGCTLRCLKIPDTRS